MENINVITCEGVNSELEVLVCNNEIIAEKKGFFWFTTDNMSEIGENVVIENQIGARIAAKRIK